MTEKQASYISSWIGRESEKVHAVIRLLEVTHKLDAVSIATASEIIGSWENRTIETEAKLVESIERKLLSIWRIS